MTEKKNYPEEIYPETATQAIDGPVYWISHRKDYEKAYDIGLAHSKEQAAQADPLAGFSNLTKAIQDCVRVDWERLDGVKAKCTHSELGTLSGRLKKRTMWKPSYVGAWRDGYGIWSQVISNGWFGKEGWSLWVEGEIPVKTSTADELKPGSVFIGNSPKSTASQMFVVAHHSNPGDPDLVAYRVDNPVTSWQWAECVEVIEVKSGGFTSPKEEA